MKKLTPEHESDKKKIGEIERFLLFLAKTNIQLSEVAKACDVSERTIKNGIWNNEPFGGRLLRGLHLKFGVSLDWLLSNSGPMLWTDRQVGEPAASYGSAPANDREARLKDFLEEWFRARPEEDQVWLEVQFRRAVPEYEGFMTKFRR
jgi:hypothetical protein